MAGKAKRSGGENSKFTKETYEQMKNYLMAGLSLRDACTMVGLAYSTWNGYEQKDPSLRRKRKQWQGMLKARAKMNIAEHIYGNKKKNIKPSAGYSKDYLDSLTDQEYKNAQNAVARATARKINAEIERIKAETKRLNSNDEGITKIVFSDDLKPDKEDDSKQKGSEDDGTDTKPK